MISAFKVATTLTPENQIFLYQLVSSQNCILTECEIRAWIFMTNWSPAEKLFFSKIRVTVDEAININFRTTNQVSIEWKRARQVST